MRKCAGLCETQDPITFGTPLLGPLDKLDSKPTSRRDQLNSDHKIITVSPDIAIGRGIGIGIGDGDIGGSHAEDGYQLIDQTDDQDHLQDER